MSVLLLCVGVHPRCPNTSNNGLCLFAQMPTCYRCLLFSHRLTEPDHERGREQPMMLGSFVEDAGNIVTSHGCLAAISHAYSALVVCVGGSSELESGTSAPDSSGENIREGRTRRRPCVYEMSVETAQKRAYASNCYNQLLSEYDQDVRQGKQTTSFIEELVEVARRDAVAIEVLCLLLLEPWRRPHTDSLHSPLNNALLQQASGRTFATTRKSVCSFTPSQLKPNERSSDTNHESYGTALPPVCMLYPTHMLLLTLCRLCRFCRFEKMQDFGPWTNGS